MNTQVHSECEVFGGEGSDLGRSSKSCSCFHGETSGQASQNKLKQTYNTSDRRPPSIATVQSVKKTAAEGKQQCYPGDCSEEDFSLESVRVTSRCENVMWKNSHVMRPDSSDFQNEYFRSDTEKHIRAEFISSLVMFHLNAASGQKKIAVSVMFSLKYIKTYHIH